MLKVEGIYNENVVVNKTVTILGENVTTTIVGETYNMGARFEILANNVTIAGFTMRWADYGILSRSSYNLFYNNLIISMFVYGICVSGSYSIIANNTINHAGYGVGPPGGGGIELFIANNNLVSNNFVTKSAHGIRLRYGDNNILIGNNLTRNSVGLGLWFSCNNTLRNNHMYNNTFKFGVESSFIGGFLNDIDVSNKVDGKPIYYWINVNNKQVPTNAGYVALINCTNIAVRDLVLSNNLQGIRLAGTTNTTIQNVTLINNCDGIYLGTPAAPPWRWTENILIINNLIMNNTDSGIRLFTASNNIISGNNIVSNNSE
jgi:parallel beta-helix repeat protein